jgi:hypothetical protein
MPIKTFSQACKILKLDPKKVLPVVKGMPLRMQKAQLAYAKLVIITQALNEGWEPNWDDSNEWKYWPWFYMNKPGFRFHGSHFVITDSYSSGGSRLCFKSEELASYAGRQFLDLYREFIA